MSQETRSRRPGRYRRVADHRGSSRERPQTSGRQPYTGREKNPAASSDLTFNKRHFQNLIVLDRPVAEVPFFAEQLAMIRRDSDVRVLWDQIEHLPDPTVHTFHTSDR